VPKASPGLSIDLLVQRVEATGATLGERATALSEIIAKIDARLGDMPGKTPVTIESNGIRLSFERYGDWGLWLIDCDTEGAGLSGQIEPDALTSVSVLRKARAFPLVLQLLPEIEAEQNRQLSMIDAALAHLRAEPLATRGDSKEGN
jgi:hypothetical protein